MTKRQTIALIGIALVPFLLIPTATTFTRMMRRADIAQYEALSRHAFERLKRLDREFLALQRAVNLLASGQERVTSRSLVRLQRSESFDSVFSKYETTKQRVAMLEEGTRALRSRLDAYGGNAIMHIDLSDQKLTLIEDGAIIAKYPLSSGAWEKPTPTGSFQVHRKQTLRISQQAVPYRMPNYMAFTPNGSHGIHALPYLGDEETNSDYWHEARSHIGIPVSHGCVRLLPEDAEVVYQWVEVGTPLYISA